MNAFDRSKLWQEALQLLQSVMNHRRLFGLSKVGAGGSFPAVKLGKSLEKLRQNAIFSNAGDCGHGFVVRYKTCGPTT